MSTVPVSQFNRVLWNQALFGSSGSGAAGQIIEAGHGLLYPALRKANVTIGPQRTPSSAQFQDAIEELNRLISSLNCDRLFIYSLDPLSFPLTGQSSYTIGQDPTGTVTADWDVPRPQMITEAYWSMDGSACSRQSLAILTPQTWSGCGDCGSLSGIYNDRAYPVSTIHLNGAATSGTLELFAWHTVPKFGSVSDVVLLPDGYEDALVLNLAVRLGTHFQRSIDPMLRADARESLMRVLSINAPQPIADTSALGCCRGGYNVYTDQ